MTLDEIVAEIDRQHQAKQDYLASTRYLSILTTDGRSELHVDGIGAFKVAPIAHEQIGRQLAVPKAFYDRLRHGVPAANGRSGRPANPELFDHVINTLWETEPRRRRMLRTLDEAARAYLSDRYRRLDDVFLVHVLEPVITGMRDPEVSAELTERRLYLKVVLPRIRHEIKPGDVVQAGFVVTNSEVGYGALSVQPMLYRLVCSNGLIVSEFYRRRVPHLGRPPDTRDDPHPIDSATPTPQDRMLFAEIADAVRAVAEEARFAEMAAALRKLTQTPPMADAELAVERLARRENLTDDESRLVLRRLADDGDLTAYGLLNAITLAARDVESYDRSVELEEIGGSLLGMSEREWLAIAA
jgi:hypothetical protein